MAQTEERAEVTEGVPSPDCHYTLAKIVDMFRSKGFKVFQQSVKEDGRPYVRFLDGDASREGSPRVWNDYLYVDKLAHILAGVPWY